MKNENNDDLRTEYDLSVLKGRTKGKYFKKASAGTNLILLDPEIAKMFPTSESVNQALKMLHEIAVIVPDLKNKKTDNSIKVTNY